MDGPRDYILSEASQKEKDKYHMTLLICGNKEKNDKMNLHTNRNSSTVIDNKFMVTKGKKEGRNKLGV